MPSRTNRTLRSRLRRAVVAGGLTGLLAGPWLALALPVAACSCAPISSLAEYAVDPNVSVFSGVAGPREARGVPVAVTTWFVGPGAGPIVWLGDGSFGDGAACGVPAPPAGSSWLFVAWHQPGQDLTVGLCQPMADLATADGRKLLAEAQATFGGVQPSGGGSPPAPQPTAAPSPVPDPAPTPGVDPMIVAGGLVAAGSLGVLGGAVLVARRRGR